MSQTESGADSQAAEVQAAAAQAAEDQALAARSAEAIRDLSSTRTVARSALWNLVGRAGPLVIAIFATPLLVHRLGPSRWGVFTIALSLVGIFGIFDFGISRSLTRTVAEMLTEGRVKEAASLARAGITALFGLGVIGGLIMAAVAHAWVYGRLQIAPSLQPEVLHAFYVLCFSAPVVLVSSALWGILAAYQRFRAANLVNVPIMAMYYLGPLAVLFFWNSLVPVLAMLVLCRLAMVCGYWRICVRAMPELKHARARLGQLRPVMRMGGWMTVSNVTFPLLTYVDRFIIASVLSAAETGYYSTPFDLVLRFTILPQAIMGTAYPAMAASYRHDPDNTQSLFRRSMVTVTAALFPACLLCVLVSDPLLTLWLGAPFAAHAAPVLRWLGVGILLTSVDSVVAGLLDGIGKASVNAKFSIAELIVYLPLLTILVRRTGIEGAAIAWAARCLADLSFRLWVAQRLYAPIRQAARSLLPLLAGVTAVLLLGSLLHGGTPRMLVGLLGFALVMGLTWRSLTGAERERLTATAGRLLPRMAR